MFGPSFIVFMCASDISALKTSQWDVSKFETNFIICKTFDL